MTSQDSRDVAFGIASTVVALFGWWWLTFTDSTSGGSLRAHSAAFGAAGAGLAVRGAWAHSPSERR